MAGGHHAHPPTTPAPGGSGPRHGRPTDAPRTRLVALDTPPRPTPDRARTSTFGDDATEVIRLVRPFPERPPVSVGAHPFVPTPVDPEVTRRRRRVVALAGSAALVAAIAIGAATLPIVPTSAAAPAPAPTSTQAPAPTPAPVHPAAGK